MEQETTELESDRVLFDDIKLSTCSDSRCSFYEEKSNEEGGVRMCVVASVAECPVVLESHHQGVPEVVIPTEISTVGEVTVDTGRDERGVLPVPHEYEVWCRETAEETAVVTAPSLVHAKVLAERMVLDGTLYPASPGDVSFGAREIDAAEISMTIVCERLGVISILHANGGVYEAMRDLNKSGYEVLAVFSGKHEDVSEI